MPHLLTLRPLSNSSRLGWSNSRYGTFDSCKRRYYYHYYGSKFDTAVPGDFIWKLKELTSIALTIGNVTHKTIEALLKRLITTEIPIDRLRLDEFIRHMVKDELRQKIFFEVYYGEKSEISEDEIFTKANESVINFLESERFAWILEKGVAEKEKWIIEPPHYGETNIAGIKAYAKFDFLCVDGDEVLIFDWKSGKEHLETHAFQLRAYSYWASYHMGIKPESITPVIAYLHPEYSEIECLFDSEQFEEFAIAVREQTKSMEGYCKDVEANTPLEKELFPLRSKDGFCERCNFKQLCWGTRAADTVE